jgi:hypothetical protein
MSSLRESLPMIVPLAVAWAEQVAASADASGQMLNEQQVQVARQVGVRHPECVRVVVASDLPFPEHPLLTQAAMQTGLLGSHMAGLTLGYAVFIRKGHLDTRLLSHELRHVSQYEEAGSIRNFLPAYLAQIVEVGYDNAPLEIDARNHEIATY